MRVEIVPQLRGWEIAPPVERGRIPISAEEPVPLLVPVFVARAGRGHRVVATGASAFSKEGGRRRHLGSGPRLLLGAASEFLRRQSLRHCLWLVPGWESKHGHPPAGFRKPP